MPILINRFLIVFFFAFLIAGSQCGEPVSLLTRFEYKEPHMGTLFRIVLYAPDQGTADKAAKAAFKRIADVDQMMSDYKEDSELMLLCKKAGTGPVPVSAELFDLIAYSRNIAVKSNGALDITIGPLVRLWRKARKTRTLPSDDEIAKAKALVSYENLVLNEMAHTVQLMKEGMMLDLGSIAKGDSVDKAIAVLKEMGIESALAAGGGDIAVSHAPPGTEGWVVGVGPLDNPAATPSEYLLLHDAGVSTAGDFEQHAEIGGKRFSHIIDPHSGLPLQTRESVTVVAPTDRQADGLDTTMNILGPEKAMQLADSEGVAAYYVQATDAGQRVIESSRWKDLPKRKKKD